ncbi:MAG: hypothetical protein AB1353_08785 [Aquificota bacterium]|jgi:hypothetical protein|nr:hypothetical protein [Aquificaceae bacterium]MDM7267320.1 hypothetical protein [Aquificaceae bacterium]QWK13667.1 MAG: hypothetical protein KNN14_03425 [Aquificota bacterium]
MENIKAQFKNLPPWQKYFLVLGLPILLIFYIWFILISPALEETNRLRLEKDRVEKEIETIKGSMKPTILNNLKKEKERLELEYAQKYAELTSMVGEIPTEKDAAKIIRNIGNIATKSGVVILNLQVSSPQKVNYELIQEGDKKIVKEVQQQQQGQQQAQQQKTQQQQKQAQQQPKGVSFLRSELKITLSGPYGSVRKFLERLAKEGVISYPSSITLTPEGANKVRAEVVLFLIMKEEGQ